MMLSTRSSLPGAVSVSSQSRRHRRSLLPLAVAILAWLLPATLVEGRILNSELGRWLSRDPLGYVDGVNRYLYSGNSPVTNVDPSGTISLAQCRADLRWCNLFDQAVAQMTAALAASGCPRPPRSCTNLVTYCRGNLALFSCKGASKGSIFICAAAQVSRDDVCRSLAHELSHALDECRHRSACLDNCNLIACTEIRACSRSGECCTGQPSRLPLESFPQCVARCATASLPAWCPPSVIQAKWNACFVRGMSQIVPCNLL